MKINRNINTELLGRAQNELRIISTDHHHHHPTHTRLDCYRLTSKLSDVYEIKANALPLRKAHTIMN